MLLIDDLKSEVENLSIVVDCAESLVYIKNIDSAQKAMLLAKKNIVRLRLYFENFEFFF